MPKLNALILLAAAVAAGLVSATGAQPKNPKAGHSSFYRDFDPELASGICQNLSPRAGGGTHPHLARARESGILRQEFDRSEQMAEIREMVTRSRNDASSSEMPKFNEIMQFVERAFDRSYRM